MDRRLSCCPFLDSVGEQVVVDFRVLNKIIPSSNATALRDISNRELQVRVCRSCI